MHFGKKKHPSLHPVLKKLFDYLEKRVLWGRKEKAFGVVIIRKFKFLSSPEKILLISLSVAFCFFDPFSSLSPSYHLLKLK